MATTLSPPCLAKPWCRYEHGWALVRCPRADARRALPTLRGAPDVRPHSFRGFPAEPLTGLCKSSIVHGEGSASANRQGLTGAHARAAASRWGWVGSPRVLSATGVGGPVPRSVRAAPAPRPLSRPKRR